MIYFYQLVYLVSMLGLIPFLPVLYLLGNRVRKSIPDLPEATVPSGELVNGQRLLNVLFIGESTMAGVGVQNHEDGIAGSVASGIATEFETGVNWMVLAKSGYTVGQITQELIPEIPANNFDMTVLAVGANNAFQLNSPLRWKREVKDLISNLRTSHKTGKIIFMNLPPVQHFPALPKVFQFIFGQLMNSYQSILENKVNAEEQIFFSNKKLNLQDWKDKNGGNASIEDFFSDGIHPSKLTYSSWSQELVSFIKENEIMKTTQEFTNS